MAMRQDASTGELVEQAEPAAPSSGSIPTMHVKVYSPYRIYYDEMAKSVSGANETGPFDILPKHHNFITLLGKCELVVRGLQGDVKIRISGGLMHVKADNVVVFLDV